MYHNHNCIAEKVSLSELRSSRRSMLFFFFKKKKAEKSGRPGLTSSVKPVEAEEVSVKRRRLLAPKSHTHQTYLMNNLTTYSLPSTTFQFSHLLISPSVILPSIDLSTLPLCPASYPTPWVHTLARLPEC